MSEQPIRIFEMETKLAQDDDGSFRNALTGALGDEMREVKQHINAGLPPDEFQQATQYAEALERAAAVVEKVWNSEHAK